MTVIILLSHFIHWEKLKTLLYIISTDQESCTVILCKTGYNNKVNGLIEDGIINGKYVETTDSTHKEWKIFQDFL